VPVAAVSVEAIRRHVGLDCVTVPGTRPGNAFRVIAECGPDPSELAVWNHERAPVLNQRVQIWVDIGYSGYRKAYRALFPEENIRNRVIHHVMNRRYATLHGYRYVRLVAISRSTNSSSSFSENWGVALTKEGTLKKASGEAAIRYADIANLMPMLDIPVGGGVMENVRVAVDLLRTGHP